MSKPIKTKVMSDERERDLFHNRKDGLMVIVEGLLNIGMIGACLFVVYLIGKAKGLF